MNRILLCGVGQLLLLLAAPAFSDDKRAAERPKVSPRTEALELVLLGENRMVRLQIVVEVDGRSLVAHWDESFKRLHAFYDTDGDGNLDAKEAARLPSVFALRRGLWGPAHLGASAPPPWDELDLDGDGKVSPQELADYYRRHGLGGASVAVGNPPATLALTDALLKHLDTDGSKQVSEKGWKSAADTLHKLDKNDDELIGPGELLAGVLYPGAIGGTLLLAPSPADSPSPTDQLPMIVLPLRQADRHWATVLVKRRDRDGDGKLSADEAGLPPAVFAALDKDKDGKLTAEELAAWRDLPPDFRWCMRLGKRQEGQSELELLAGTPRKSGPYGWLGLDAGRLWVDARLDKGKLPELEAAARKRFVDLFAQAARNGIVDGKELGKDAAVLKPLIDSADRFGNGRLSEKEFTTWLELQEQIWKGHVLLSVLDHGAGLFELLDANHDGSLSVRELRDAWDWIRDAGCLTDGQLDRKKLPQQLILAISRGHPLTQLVQPIRRGPAWFQAMDRNGDGYVSRREFIGTQEQFDKLDTDKDGLISPEEAEKAEGPGKK